LLVHALTYTHLSVEHKLAGASLAIAALPLTRYGIRGVFALECRHQVLNTCSRYESRRVYARLVSYIYIYIYIYTYIHTYVWTRFSWSAARVLKHLGECLANASRMPHECLTNASRRQVLVREAAQCRRHSASAPTATGGGFGAPATGGGFGAPATRRRRVRSVRRRRRFWRAKAAMIQTSTDASVMAVLFRIKCDGEGFECSASQGHDAAPRGDPDLIHVLFDTGVDINKPDGRTGRSPLWQAPTGM